MNKSIIDDNFFAVKFQTHVSMTLVELLADLRYPGISDIRTRAAIKADDQHKVLCWCASIMFPDVFSPSILSSIEPPRLISEFCSVCFSSHLIWNIIGRILSHRSDSQRIAYVVYEREIRIRVCEIVAVPC